MTNLEGSHRGLVRPPAKRLGDESPLMGSNPIPSAITQKLEGLNKYAELSYLDYRMPNEQSGFRALR